MARLGKTSKGHESCPLKASKVFGDWFKFDIGFDIGFVKFDTGVVKFDIKFDTCTLACDRNPSHFTPCSAMSV